MIGWVAISLVMAATVATMATLVATAPVPGALVVLRLRMSGGQAKAGCCYSAKSGLITMTMDYLGDKMEITLELWERKLIMNMCDPGMLWAASFVFVLVLSVPCFGSWSLVPCQKKQLWSWSVLHLRHHVNILQPPQKSEGKIWKGRAF